MSKSVDMAKNEPLTRAAIDASAACVQCKANAKTNLAGGYAELAQKCLDYCASGHDAATVPEKTVKIIACRGGCGRPRDKIEGVIQLTCGDRACEATVAQRLVKGMR